ncbi:MAG: heparinase II/III family protein, partial [Rikenellaceae bacterium]
MKRYILTLLTLCFCSAIAMAAPGDNSKEIARAMASVDRYIDNGPEWLASRLCMYWKSHATDVYIKNATFSHIGGERAPEPTVAYSGSRNLSTPYKRPKIEELKPYDENPQGVLMKNSDGDLEYAPIGKTARLISYINLDIINVARDAALLYAHSGDARYAEFATMTFDIFMAGIFHRNLPIDMNKGAQQGLIGMTTYSVIHEKAITPLTELYADLKGYLHEHKAEREEIYIGAFKKWADNIIDNGVPFNNWNLFQAGYVMEIATILESDDSYADKKGQEYYLNQILNVDNPRQWSLTKLFDYGFDPQTGIWAECPGYSYAVIKDVINFITMYGDAFGEDLLKRYPVLEKAITVTPQYLYPSLFSIGYGDTYPFQIDGYNFEKMIIYARKFGYKELEREMTAMLKLFAPDARSKGLEVDPSIPAAKIEDYVTSTFYAPSVSWFVQRNGMDPLHSLMISQNGSLGNHMHASGINMELYGKGYTLAANAGKGPDAYLGTEFLDYYSQFPSHNTVCVNGISSYPIMRCNHAFKLIGCYPEPATKGSLNQPITYSDVSFIEPETLSDQSRVMGIVTTSQTSGYYVDIFRSKQREGGDIMHDYFYHNLGTEMVIQSSEGVDLDMQPTQELSSASVMIGAYSFFFDTKSNKTDENIKVTYTMNIPSGDDIYMTLWQKGEEGRTLFSTFSPVNTGLGKMRNMPYNVHQTPTRTFVARQSGEAWSRPFVTIFEPSTKSEEGTIEAVEYFSDKAKSEEFVGILVKHKDGRE